MYMYNLRAAVDLVVNFYWREKNVWEQGNYYKFSSVRLLFCSLDCCGYEIVIAHIFFHLYSWYWCLFFLSEGLVLVFDWLVGYYCFFLLLDCAVFHLYASKIWFRFEENPRKGCFHHFIWNYFSLQNQIIEATEFRRSSKII